MGDIPEDIVQKGVEDAMDFTFSSKPKSEAERGFVKLIENFPGATVAIPFPRFLVNSMRFMAEYSPLGALHLASKAERAAIKAGKTKNLSKALAGSALLYSAYALRDSEYAGENWYELKGDDGKTIDMRPYAPFSAYLFVGDVIKRSMNGTLYDLKGSDISEAIAGIGSDKTGLQLVDGLLGEIRQDPEFGIKKIDQYLGKLAGEYAGTFFIPFQQIRDVMAAFEPEEAKVRRVDQEPLGPVKAKIPVVGRELPESFSFTNPQTRERIDPALRQVTGITQIAPKNAAEKEMDRLQVKEFEIFQRTGNVDADRLIASKTAALVDELVSEFVSSEQYQNMTNDQKRLVLKEFLGKINTASRNQAMQENPELFIEEKIKGKLNKDELRVLEEAGVQFPEQKADGGVVNAERERIISEIRKTPWFSEFVRQYGEEPDLSERSNYDYMTAWKSGIRPRINPNDQRYHWDSKTPDGRMLKKPDHPTIWKTYFMDATGIDPDTIGIKNEQEAQAYINAKRVKKARGGYTPQEEVLLRRYSSR